MYSLIKGWNEDPRHLRIRSKDRILFSRRLALYLQAGLPIFDAISLIRATPGSKNHARLLRSLSHDVLEGFPLSHSLSRFPRAYSATHLQILVVGERTGSLPASLFHIATITEQRASQVRTIVGALAYPAVLLLGSIGISLFLVISAFPKIIPLFRGLHATLPFTTRALLAFSLFSQKHWLLLITGATIGILIALGILRIPRIKRFTDEFILRTPFIGALVMDALLVSIFRTIAILLSSGIRLDEALLVARNSMSNTTYCIALERVQEAILGGNKLSDALGAEKGLFPLLAIQLSSVGEMTGTLSESVASVARISEEEFANRLRIVSSMLEPAIMVVMGFVIGFIALAIISPMYGITQSLSV